MWKYHSNEYNDYNPTQVSRHFDWSHDHMISRTDIDCWITHDEDEIQNVLSSLELTFTVKTVHACPLTSKFLVQLSNAEYGGLETAYKNSRQMFQHSNRMFEQILQISFKISFGAWAFQTKISRR